MEGLVYRRDQEQEIEMSEEEDNVCIDRHEYKVDFYCGHCKKDFVLPSYFSVCPTCHGDDLGVK